MADLRFLSHFSPRPLQARRWGGVSVSLLAMIALAGWTVEAVHLVSIIPGEAPMQVNAGLCFLCVGLALLTKPASRTSRAAAWVAGCTAAATLTQDVSGADFGIDTLFTGLPFYSENTPNPGRMSPDTALLFVLSAVALSFRRSVFLVVIPAFGVWWGALRALGTYVPFLQPFSAAPDGMTIMALNTALTFFVTATSILIHWTKDYLK